MDEKGSARVTISDQAVKDAIKAAEDLAKSTGLTENGIAVSIDFSDLQTQFNTIPLTLTREVYETLTDAGVSYLEIKTAQVSLSLDLETLKNILQNMGDEITIRADRVDPSSLTGEAGAELGSRPTYRFSIAYENKKISEFGDGWVSISLPYIPSDNENPGGLYGIYVDDLGNLSWIWDSTYNKDRKALEFRTNHFSTFGIGYKESPSFTDIGSHWAKDDIEYIALRGFMKGTSPTSFSPQEGMTRGMFVTVLGRMAGLDTRKYENSKFTDVKTGTYYTPYVAWAEEVGITRGTSSNTFSPDKLISRQEMAVLFLNYIKVEGNNLPKSQEEISFEDEAAISSFAKDSVKAMQVAGIINGKNNNIFDPQGTATRGEVATILRRYTEFTSK